MHPRHPYVGELVYTSFSGSHQDAIKKAFAARQAGDLWVMPYLPIDPADLGRSYEAVIRVNSQSGKGGISYLLETEYGVDLPRRLQIEFSQIVQPVMDARGQELTAADLWSLFQAEYRMRETELTHQEMHTGTDGQVVLSVGIRSGGAVVEVQGKGNGPVAAFVAGVAAVCDQPVSVVGYSEHAINAGADASAVAYLELQVGQRTLFGVGTDMDIVSASFKAIVSALLRCGVHLDRKSSASTSSI